MPGVEISNGEKQLEVRDHVSTRSSTSAFQIGRFASIISSFDAFEINSQVVFVVEDISC